MRYASPYWHNGQSNKAEHSVSWIADSFLSSYQSVQFSPKIGNNNSSPKQSVKFIEEKACIYPIRFR